MAREYAPVRLTIWADDDFRALSPRAQHLYFVLLTSPSLSFCGVADWRPKRIAALAAGWSPGAVEQAAAELSSTRYIVIDEETEEVLIRSFIRHDGLMKQPNMAVAMATAYMAVASGLLRSVIAEEVRRLAEDQPELACWGAKSSKDLLAQIIEQASRNPSVNPSGNPSVNPSNEQTEGFAETSGKGSVNPSPTPGPRPATKTNSKTRTSAAPPEPPDDDPALFNSPPRPESEGQIVNRLSRIYTDRVKLTAFHAVAGVVKAAVRAEVDGVREYTNTQIADGMRLLADERRTVTQNSLRTAIEGLPPLPSRARDEPPRAGSSVWDRVVNPSTDREKESA